MFTSKIKNKIEREREREREREIVKFIYELKKYVTLTLGII